MNFLPLVLVSLFFAIAVLWRSWLQRRRHGDSGWFLFHGAPVRGAIGLLASLALLGDAGLAALAPGSRAVLHPSSPSPALGTLIVLLALFLMVQAQLQLGASWRIGIDPVARPGLVTDGVYRRCRNPIFACAIGAQIGFLLLLPDALTLMLTIAAVAAIHRQVRAEERYLETTYGDAFRHYRAVVPRYVPFSFTASRGMLCP
jgi:protein-S-isoprenylcysteine O-methyltransferase Ste14